MHACKNVRLKQETVNLRGLHTVSLSQRVRRAGAQEFKTYRTGRGNQNEQYILPTHHFLAMGRHKTEDHPPPCLKWWCGSLTTQCSSGCSAPSAKNPKSNHRRDCPCNRKTLSDSASSAVQLAVGPAISSAFALIVDAFAEGFVASTMTDDLNGASNILTNIALLGVECACNRDAIRTRVHASFAGSWEGPGHSLAMWKITEWHEDTKDQRTKGPKDQRK